MGKRLSRLPVEVLKRYEKWKDIVRISGPSGLRLVKGFHDEGLGGEWRGHRSSRLGHQYRVVYAVVADEIRVEVVDLTAHDYRRKEVIAMAKSDYRVARRTVDVTVGESVRIIRELQEMSQNELAELAGIPQSTISAIENDKVKLGVERAKALARALKVHPAVLVFPGWEIGKESAA